jgi:hypothetical protein
MQPKIAIGCPVRNRAWVLPEYTDALRDAAGHYVLTHGDRVDQSRIEFLFLENDSTDGTLDVLAAAKTDMEEAGWNVTVASISTAADMWQRGDYAHNQYANLANVRNQFLEMFLRTDADYLLSVDSDVIVPPDIVARLYRSLLDHELYSGGEVIMGAAISNVPNKPLDGETPGNYMYRQCGEGVYFHPATFPTSGTHIVDLIGAVYLIPCSVIEAGARYAPHPQGEDAPFCQAAQKLGYRLLVNMDVKCEHRMVKPE